MPMDSSYYQFVLSLLVIAGASCVMISSEKYWSPTAKAMSRFIELSQTTGSSVLAAVYIVASIVNRSELINGDMLPNPNYQFDEDFILESEFRH
jgi:hypothetical protein